MPLILLSKVERIKGDKGNRSNKVQSFIQFTWQHWVNWLIWFKTLNLSSKFKTYPSKAAGMRKTWDKR